MAASAYEFWERVDDLRGDMTLKDICEKTGVKYTRVRNSRSEVRFPKQGDMELIATELGTTCAYLMFGDEHDDSDSRVNAIISAIRKASDLELSMIEKILGIGESL